MKLCQDFDKLLNNQLSNYDTLEKIFKDIQRILEMR
jgi:hypothetical protein